MYQRGAKVVKKNRKKRKIKIIDHIIRRNTFITNIFGGKDLGKEGVDRGKKYLEDIKDRAGANSYMKTKRTAED